MTGEEGDRSVEVTERIVRGLRELSPPGWQRLQAWFAMTVVSEAALLLADDGTRSIRCAVPDTVWEAVRHHRRLTARSGDGPWWRLLVRIDEADAEVVADYGAEPFPGEQLFAPDAYRADVEAFPRARLPVWLAAYIGRVEPRSRPPRRAGDDMRADQRAGVRAVAVDGDLPDLMVLWARWTTLAAAFVAAGSERGPRVGPSVGRFESAGHSGSTMTLLTGDRAVLSGGVWNAPALDAAYNDGAALPKFFAGAPDWVADPVLDPRAATGLLSFCYWYEAGRWYRGESAPVPECAAALPAVWTVDTVVEIVAELAGDGSTALRRRAAALVTAAQAAAVTRAAVVDVFGAGEHVDIDGALFQFVVAGLAPDHAVRITGAEAIDRVRDHIRERGYGTDGYPLSTLTAERIGVGWIVRSPVPAGQAALDRAVFYVADDGVVERSTTSVPRSVAVAGIERRFRLRRAGRS